MKARMITPATRANFKNLIIPKVYLDMENGAPVTAIGLSEGSKPVGALAGMIETGQVFTVKSLYVDPKYRRQGGATLLTTALERLLDLRDAIAVISYVEDDDESRTLTSFMESRECSLESGLERLFRGRVSDYLKSGLFTRGYRNKEIKRLADFDKSQYMEIKKMLTRLFAEMDIKPMSDYMTDRDMSFVAVKGGKLTGALLAGFDKSRPDEPVIVISEQQDPRITGGLLNMFLNACNIKMGPDTYVRFPVSDDRFDRVIEHIKGVQNIQHNYLF